MLKNPSPNQANNIAIFSYLLKVVFFQKGLMCLSFLQTGKPNHFPELKFWIIFPSKWLKSFKILAQVNDKVCLFEEMTNASALSEKKPPLPKMRLSVVLEDRYISTNESAAWQWCISGCTMIGWNFYGAVVQYVIWPSFSKTTTASTQSKMYFPSLSVTLKQKYYNG